MQQKKSKMSLRVHLIQKTNLGLVSKETVMLRRWGTEKHKTLDLSTELINPKFYASYSKSCFSDQIV